MQKILEDETGILPLHTQLIQMATGYRVSQIVYAAAKLGLADYLADQPKTAAELAGPTGTKEPLLYRLMRTLASLGIMSEDPERRFSLTPLGEALKSGAPGCARGTILTFGDEMWWQAWGEFIDCLKTGKSGVKLAYGMSIWDYVDKHPDLGSYLNEAMIGFHGAESLAVSQAYDFSGFKTLVDVGGGTGNCLMTILDDNPGLRGILFELPHVTEEASGIIEKRGFAERITVETGDFFVNVAEGGDAYILSHIIHDWDDEHSLVILRNCRKAMNPGGRLLILEMVIPAGNAPHPGKILDMEMIVIDEAQERTEEEYRSLLDKAGFKLERVIPTESAVSVVEAIPK